MPTFAYVVKDKAGRTHNGVLDIETKNALVERLWKQLGPCICRSWQYLQDHAPELAQRYGGKYVMVVDDRIIASGRTQLEAYRNAPTRLTEHRDAGIYYIPLPEESLTAF